MLTQSSPGGTRRPPPPTDKPGTRAQALLHDPGIERLLRLVSVAGIGLLITVLFGALTVRAVAPPSDPDTWWHLVMGQRYLDGVSVRHPGAMSFFGTEDWHSRDWLPQMAAAAFENWFGLPGVAWLYGLGMVSLTLTLFRVSKSHSSPAAAALAAATGTVGAMTSMTARPQLASFVLLAITMGWILGTARDLKPRWLLVVMTPVWACTHGLWFLSPLLQVVLVLGLILDRRLTKRLGVQLAGVFGLSLLAVAATPNGLSLLRRPLGSIMAIAPYIQEYDPPTLKSLFYFFTIVMLAVTFLAWPKRIALPGVHLMLMLVAAVFALEMQRTISVGAVMLTPIFARSLDTWLSRLDLSLPRMIERTAIYWGAALALIAIAVVAPRTADAPSSHFPTQLDGALESVPADAVLINELADGGYLRWQHPRLRIVIDGLSDQYAVPWQLAALRADSLGPGWEEFVTRTHAQYALLSENTPLATALLLRQWRVVASDDHRVLLAAPEVNEHG